MKSARSANRIVLLAAAVAIAGCGHTVGPRVPPPEAQKLPAVPEDLRLCFAGVVDLPAGAWSAEVTGELFTEVRKSELRKTDCGRRLLKWYEDVSAGRAGS